MAGRPQNKGIDMLLLRKIFQQGQMTVVEISEMFETLHGSHISGAKIAKLRRQMGIETPKTMKCIKCGEMKALNCFRAGYTGICVKCRVKLGIEKVHQRGHGKQAKVIKMRGVLCHGCHKPFPKDAPARFDPRSKRRLDYYCPVCKAGNDEIEDFDELIIRFG